MVNKKKLTKLVAGLVMVLSVSALCGCSGDEADIMELDPKAYEEELEKLNKDADIENPDEDVDVENYDEYEDKENPDEDMDGEDIDDSEEMEASEGPELDSVDFDMTVYDENDEYTVFECYGNSYVVSDEYADMYPELAETLTELDEAEKAEMQRNLDSFEEEAREFAERQQEEGENMFYISDSEEYLVNADDKVVSLLRSQCFYFDQPHPNYYYLTFNIDVGSGQFIPLSEIISDKEGLDEVLAERLVEEYPDVEFTDLEETLSNFDLEAGPMSQESAPYCFTMDQDGLSFHFSQETLANYAYGAQEIRLLFDEIPELLTEGYTYGSVG